MDEVERSREYLSVLFKYDLDRFRLARTARAARVTRTASSSRTTGVAGLAGCAICTFLFAPCVLEDYVCTKALSI